MSLRAVVPGPGGVAVADADGERWLDRAPADDGTRVVWWRASSAALALGVRPRACWDLGAVHRLLTGARRDDPGAVWAGAQGRAEPAPPTAQATLLDVDESDGLPAGLAHDAPAGREEALAAARLALQVHAAQAAAVAGLPDPRPAPTSVPLRTLSAYAESAAALLAVELAADGLPVDRAEAERLLTALVGPRPRDDADEARQRRARDAAVLRLLPAEVDLRNPAQVREVLLRVGLDLPDTRSWRLEPHRATSPAVAALLDWRRAERVATTYGWRWLDAHVGPDDRLRGEWGAADAAAGRMTASAGLHNLPADLRSAVAAEPGHVLVRADLGQVEPRVLAVVSGDPGLAGAAAEQDMYAPVAAALGCDRPTAKVAVLAAMYGQTSGTAGRALERMDRAYPVALAHLREAERVGRDGGELRTWGGRLLRSGGGGSGRGLRNAVVQGAAAELFKVWAASVRAGLPALGGQVVLCLHDELLLHVPEAQAGAARELLHEALAASGQAWAAGTGVRLVADVAVVRRWSEAKG